MRSPIMASRRSLFILAWLFMASVTLSKRIHSFAGPYLAYADKWFPCPSNEYDHRITPFLKTTHFNPRTPNILQKLTGNITFEEEFNDKYWALVKMDTWANNQWKENAFVLKFPGSACSSLRSNIPDFFRVMFGEHSYKKECSVPKGVYNADNAFVNWTFPNFPVMPYGHWRFTIYLGTQTLSTKAAGCARVECITMPQL